MCPAFTELTEQKELPGLFPGESTRITALGILSDNNLTIQGLRGPWESCKIFQSISHVLEKN